MMRLIGATIVALSLRLCAAAKDISGLPWSELKERVGDRLIDTIPQDFIDQCLPEYYKPYHQRTLYELIDQPSGLCTAHLFCGGFQQCAPNQEYLNGQINGFENWESLRAFNNFFTAQIGSPPTSTAEDYDKAHNTSYAKSLQEWLNPANQYFSPPPKVLFPTSAGDVVAAVDFAKTYGVEISIKNSGHSYSGSSTKANTLLINMNKYKRYASDDKENKGIIECNDAEVGKGMITTSVDLDTELCRLVRARGKPAAIRVGGGENFNKAFSSVKEINERKINEPGGKYKYHLVGGAVGTVSPMGWTWMGGLGGTAGGRLHGFGVDQVLQIEAVLPSGEHVRFGPTDWEDSDGYLQPKTTKVSGVCNTNPQDEEEQWVWGACPEETDVLFDDLWFAFRGGGGGTWGVVLSVYLQLHDYMPLVNIEKTSDVCSSNVDLATIIAKFVVDYLLDPGALNITREQSNMCAAANENLGTLRCYSNDPAMGENLISLYQDFVSKNSEGLTEELAAIAPSCLSATNHTDWSEIVKISEGPHEGKMSGTPFPSYVPDLTLLTNLLVPKSWVLDKKMNSETKTNKDILVDWYFQNPLFTYWAFGGDSEFSHDQTSSLSTAHREAGVMVLYLDSGSSSPKIPNPWLPSYFMPSTYWPPHLPEMYDFTSGDIPPHIGSNHLGPNLHGPLRDNPTKPCPTWDLSSLEADSMCHSAQEAVWGTKTLKRLESIKTAVDPNGMFDCFHCIGNEVTRDEESSSSLDNDESAGGANEIVDSEIEETAEESSSVAVDAFEFPMVAVSVFAAMVLF